jgi:hypothetical protein
MSRNVVLLCYDDGRPDLKIDYRRTLLAIDGGESWGSSVLNDQEGHWQLSHRSVRVKSSQQSEYTGLHSSPCPRPRTNEVMGYRRSFD